MVQGGFREAKIQVFGWGNKACAKAHIGGPVRAYGLRRDISNDEEYPLMIWSFDTNQADPKLGESTTKPSDRCWSPNCRAVNVPAGAWENYLN